jgi:hypothetical protein
MNNYPEHGKIVIAYPEKQSHCLPMLAKLWHVDNGLWYLWVTANSDFSSFENDGHDYDILPFSVFGWSELPEIQNVLDVV